MAGMAAAASTLVKVNGLRSPRAASTKMTVS
jgi:hypothetical protein